MKRRGLAEDTGDGPEDGFYHVCDELNESYETVADGSEAVAKKKVGSIHPSIVEDDPKENSQVGDG